MQLQPDIGLILSEDLDAVDVAEVGQQRHQVGAGVDNVTDAVTRADQQRHLCLFLPLLRRVKRMHRRLVSNSQPNQGVWANWTFFT